MATLQPISHGVGRSRIAYSMTNLEERMADIDVALNSQQDIRRTKHHSVRSVMGELDDLMSQQRSAEDRLSRVVKHVGVIQEDITREKAEGEHRENGHKMAIANRLDWLEKRIKKAASVRARANKELVARLDDVETRQDEISQRQTEVGETLKDMVHGKMPVVEKDVNFLIEQNQRKKVKAATGQGLSAGVVSSPMNSPIGSKAASDHVPNSSGNLDTDAPDLPPEILRIKHTLEEFGTTIYKTRRERTDENDRLMNFFLNATRDLATTLNGFAKERDTINEQYVKPLWEDIGEIRAGMNVERKERDTNLAGQMERVSEAVKTVQHAQTDVTFTMDEIQNQEMATLERQIVQLESKIQLLSKDRQDSAAELRKEIEQEQVQRDESEQEVCNLLQGIHVKFQQGIQPATAASILPPISKNY